MKDKTKEIEKLLEIQYDMKVVAKRNSEKRESIMKFHYAGIYTTEKSTNELNKLSALVGRTMNILEIRYNKQLKAL